MSLQGLLLAAVAALAAPSALLLKIPGLALHLLQQLYSHGRILL